MPTYMEHYSPENLLGNVIGVIADRSTLPAQEVAKRVAMEYGGGDFTAAESLLWDQYFGPLCDQVMADLKISA